MQDIYVYYMTSDNVFSDWLTSLVTFFDKTFDHIFLRKNVPLNLNLNFGV